jgi:hypothetical protein
LAFSWAGGRQIPRKQVRVGRQNPGLPKRCGPQRTRRFSGAWKSPPARIGKSHQKAGFCKGARFPGPIGRVEKFVARRKALLFGREAEGVHERTGGVGPSCLESSQNIHRVKQRPIIDLARTSLIRSALMKLPHSAGFLRILALLALLLFAGDIIADAIDDMSEGHCTSETSQSCPTNDRTPCSHCSCATHSGAVVIADFALSLGRQLGSVAHLQSDDEATPPRLAASIDHPPQLV